MSGLGFLLSRLVLIGTDVEAAEVTFTTGLNVITGPSDTGKTFILECIDFMLGARDIPKQIPEAKNYDTVILEIVSQSDNTRYKLSRSLRGGAFRLQKPDGSYTVLAEKHAAERDDTLSHFLLNFIKLTEKRIRTNSKGTTRSLSFRDIAHLFVISEEEIIRTHTPLFSGQSQRQTAEKSTFCLLLSGNDDSAVVTSEDPKISKVRYAAKAEVLQELIQRARQQLSDLDITEESFSLRARYTRIQVDIENSEKKLSELGASISEIENARQSKWTILRQIESRLEVLRGLSERFILLNAQYISDLKRLDAITEAGIKLGDFAVERCPVCGALPEHHDKEHRLQEVDPKSIANASAIEAQRIRSLMSDLTETCAQISIEESTLSSEKASFKNELSELTLSLSEKLKPQVSELTKKLRQANAIRDHISQALALYQQIEEFENISQSLDIQSAYTRHSFSNNVFAKDIEMFAQEAEQRLRGWNFPGLDRVTFSEEDWDIVISGIRRTSHGKGVRAITHAAFTTALLAYCISRHLPHPGFVILDSPLVVYREPDADEPELAADVKNSFFHDLATTFVNQQIIVFENEQPTDDLIGHDGLTLIRFTKSNYGRYGFIPTKAST